MSIKTCFPAAEPLVSFMDIMKTISFAGVQAQWSTPSMTLKNFKGANKQQPKHRGKNCLCVQMDTESKSKTLCKDINCNLSSYPP